MAMVHFTTLKTYLDEVSNFMLRRLELAQYNQVGRRSSNHL